MTAEPDIFGQPGYRCRLGWGRRGAVAGADRGDVLVIVDTLSFSTAVATAVENSGLIHACRWGGNAPEVAERLGAECAVDRREVPEKGRYSLSPGSMRDIEPGTKVVVASPNGATCTELGGRVPHLFVAGLVNASAVGATVTGLLEESGGSVTVVACGERWPDNSEDGRLRVAIEDYLGAGAVIAAIDAEKSPEARVCEAAFQALRDELPAILADCGSGRELREAGFGDDVDRAAKLDCFDSVPVLQGKWLVRRG